MDPLYISLADRIKYETNIKVELDADSESIELNSEDFEEKPLIKTEELDLEEDVIILSDDDGSERFLCDQCGFVSYSESLFTRHKVHHAEPTEKKFKCEDCPFEAIYKADLNKHISEKHSVDLEPLRKSTPLLESILKDKEAMVTYKKSLEANNITKLSNNKQNQKILYCGGKCPFNTKCPLKTHNIDVLTKHAQLLRQGATSSKIIDANAQQEQTQQIKTVKKTINLKAKPSIYRCCKCDYRNFSREKVIEHMRWLHPVPPKTIQTVTWYKCGGCSFKAETEEIVRSHLRDFHFCGKKDK